MRRETSHVTPSLINTGIYQVVGAEQTQVSSVTVNTLPTINASTTKTLMCTSETVSLTANGTSTYTWSPGGTGMTISVPTTTSTYTINETDVNGCMNFSGFTHSVSLCTGIQTLAENATLNIYPNTFNDKIIMSSNVTKQTITIFNALGLVIYDSIIKNESTEIDLTKPSIRNLFSSHWNNNKTNNKTII